MKKTYYILILFLTLSCNNSAIIELKNNQTVLEKEIQNFYDFILKMDIDSSSYIADRPGFLLMDLDSSLICNNTLFDITDWEYIVAQKKIFRNLKIESTNLNFINVDSIFSKLKMKNGRKKHWEILDKEYTGLGFYSYSLPFFNKSRNLVIIEYSFHCRVLCGHGKIRVFEKKNNEWNYLMTLDSCIS